MSNIPDSIIEFYNNFCFINKDNLLCFTSYEINGNYLIPSMELLIDSPKIEYLDIIIDFMKIENNENILDFANKHGLLGRSCIPKFKGSIDEPIEWILTHVNAVKLCCLLTMYIDDYQCENIRNLLKKYLDDDKESLTITIGKKAEVFNFFLGIEFDIYNDDDEYILQLAKRIRRFIINCNISDICRQIVSSEELALIYALKQNDIDEEFDEISYFKCSSLIEMIYWVLAEILIGNGNKLRFCRECNSPFIQIHGSQFHCASENGTYYCSNRKRYKKFTNKNKNC